MGVTHLLEKVVDVVPSTLVLLLQETSQALNVVCTWTKSYMDQVPCDNPRHYEAGENDFNAKVAIITGGFDGISCWEETQCMCRAEGGRRRGWCT